MTGKTVRRYVRNHQDRRLISLAEYETKAAFWEV